MKIAIVDDKLHWHDKIETVICKCVNAEIDNYSNGKDFLLNKKSMILFLWI